MLDDACHGIGECVVNTRDSESLCSPGMGMEGRDFQPPSLAIALGLAFWADCKGIRQANETFQKDAPARHKHVNDHDVR